MIATRIEYAAIIIRYYGTAWGLWHDGRLINPLFRLTLVVIWNTVKSSNASLGVDKLTLRLKIHRPSANCAYIHSL